MFLFHFFFNLWCLLLSFAFSDWGREGTLHLKLALTWVLADAEGGQSWTLPLPFLISFVSFQTMPNPVLFT